MTPADYCSLLSTQVIVQRKGSQGGAAGAAALAGGSITIVVPAVAVSGITPNFGDPAGGEYVEIPGSSFTGASGAAVGGVPLTSFQFMNDSLVSGVTGAHAASATPVGVSVTVNGVTTTLPSAFTYEYQSLAWSQKA